MLRFAISQSSSQTTVTETLQNACSAFSFSPLHLQPEEWPKPQPNEVNAASSRRISLMPAACTSLPPLNTAAVLLQASRLTRTPPSCFLADAWAKNAIHKSQPAQHLQQVHPSRTRPVPGGLTFLRLSPLLFQPILLSFTELC